MALEAREREERVRGGVRVCSRRGPEGRWRIVGLEMEGWRGWWILWEMLDDEFSLMCIVICQRELA